MNKLLLRSLIFHLNFYIPIFRCLFTFKSFLYIFFTHLVLPHLPRLLIYLATYSPTSLLTHSAPCSSTLSICLPSYSSTASYSSTFPPTHLPLFLLMPFIFYSSNFPSIHLLSFMLIYRPSYSCISPHTQISSGSFI